jgi:hypothetical protein
MTAVPSATRTVRPPRKDDAEAVFDLVAASNTPAAGRTGTILHVDTNNPTPALDLYLSVGMTASLVIDIWQLEVEA